ncbi:MAG: hypothetical protein RL065_1398 [Bacteroidota bacterium]
MSILNRFMKLKISTFLLLVGILLCPFLSKAQHTINANKDTDSIGVGGTIIAVMNNDFYNNPNGNNGDSLYILFVSVPAHGTASINHIGIGGNQDNISYNTNGFTCGYDSFYYIISDTATPTIRDTAWVVLKIGSPPSNATNITITNPVCTGDTIFFSCNSGINTPHWLGPNSFSSTNASGFISNAVLAHGGIYHLSVSNASNCYSKDTAINVVVKNAPSMPTVTLSQNPACLGKNVTLAFAPVTGGASITWSGPNSFSGSNVSYSLGPIAATDAGIYGVTLSLNGCVKSDTIHLTTKSCPVPVSGFTVNHDTICSGSTVTFTDTSLNTPTSWSWNFNSTSNINVTANPITSLAQNPTITFTNSSNTIQAVTISFQASNGNGAGNTNNTKTIYIRQPKPVAAFNASSVTICKDSALNFTDISSNVPTSWAWTFSGSNTATSTLQNPTGIIYPNVNVNTVVTLTASNYCGSDTKTLNVHVITVPAAAFSYTPNGTLCNHTPIFFTDASLNATTYSWNFGNGRTSTSQNPIDSFSNSGNYSVSLTATNACGTSTASTQILTVKNCSPSVAKFKFFTVNAPGDTSYSDTVCMNQIVYVVDTSLNGPSTSTWTFQSATPGGSGLTSESFQFNSAGTFNVTLTSRNIYGASTITRTFTVLRCLPPVASFFGSNSVCVGQCADFTNTTSEFPDSVIWKFKGASYDTTTNWTPASPCYKIPGIYSVVLMACNKYGCDSVENFVTVLPSPRIYSTDTCIEAGYTVKLLAHGNGLITWMPNFYLNTDLGDTVKSTPINKVTYTVHDTTSCPSPDSVTICLNYSNTKLEFPNTFTPDGNGRNDLFKVKSNIPLLEYEMKIYDRWGVQVFISNDYTSGWDGTYKGVAQNSGVFVYVVSYRDLGNNEYKTIHGNITLIK